MSDISADPLLLGQWVVAILETGLRTATYKLATLMALVDHCIEHLPESPGATLRVPIPDLAHRVLALYWRQVRPFEGKVLRQSTQPRARVLVAVNNLRESLGLGAASASLEVAMSRAPAAYATAIDEITLCLAQQPLQRLQRLPGMTRSDPFLYDDTKLHGRVSRAALREAGDVIELKPGVAFGLARLAGLLKPSLELMWVEDVRRMNKFLEADVPDVAGHLFGRERCNGGALSGPAACAVRRPGPGAARGDLSPPDRLDHRGGTCLLMRASPLRRTCSRRRVVQSGWSGTRLFR